MGFSTFSGQVKVLLCLIFLYLGVSTERPKSPQIRRSP